MPPDPDADAGYMRRALRLAMFGRGAAEPNPLVGCVIVRDGGVIGEGYHRRFGGPHAEPEALAACAATGRPTAGATAYVTLEPCCHANKKTPPCVPRLVAAGLARVVVGAVDPNPDVSGRGIARLRAAGLAVDVGVGGDACRQLIAPFFAARREGRPYVTLKWAQTADGKIAGPGGRRLAISNAASLRAVHELRGRCDAVMVGLRTARADDPLLTVRGVAAARAPTRVVLDPGLNLPPASRLVKSAADVPLVVACSRTAWGLEAERRARLEALGVAVEGVRADSTGHLVLADLLRQLGRARAGEGARSPAPAPAHPWAHLLVEPGPTLARAFLSAGLADRVWVFHSPMRVGDASAPPAEAVPAAYLATGRVELAGDVLGEFLNPQSPAFFAAEPSADLVPLLEGAAAEG